MRAAVGATQKHYRPNITHRFVCVIHTAKLVAEDTIWWRQNEYQCSKYKIPHHVSIQAVGCLISSILFDIVVRWLVEEVAQFFIRSILRC